MPDWLVDEFFGGYVRDDASAEFHFEVGDAGEGVRFERLVGGGVDGGDTQEIVFCVAFLFRVAHDLPLEQIGSHQVAIVVGGGSIIVRRGIGEVGGDQSGDGLARAIRYPQCHTVTERLEHRLVVSEVVRCEAVARAGLRDEGVELANMISGDVLDRDAVLFGHVDVVPTLGLHLFEDVFFGERKIEDEGRFGRVGGVSGAEVEMITDGFIGCGEGGVLFYGRINAEVNDTVLTREILNLFEKCVEKIFKLRWGEVIAKNGATRTFDPGHAQRKRTDDNEAAPKERLRIIVVCRCSLRGLRIRNRNEDCFFFSRDFFLKVRPDRGLVERPE